MRRGKTRERGRGNEPILIRREEGEDGVGIGSLRGGIADGDERLERG
jgi:hypothetical protein